MKRISLLIWLGLLLGLVPAPELRAQAANDSAGPPEKAIRQKTVRIGGDVVVAEGETAREVVVLGGQATIRGVVRTNVVVVNGTADVDGTVEGNLVVIASQAVLGPKAHIKGNLTRVGSTVKCDPAAKIDGGLKGLPLQWPWSDLSWLVNWLTQGLLQARPFPPRLGWVWEWAVVFFLLHLGLAALFPRAAQASLDALQQRPVGSLLTGLLAQLLGALLLALLVVSGVGWLVLPCFGCAVFAALAFGKIAVYRCAGQQVARRLGRDFTQRPLLALAAGAVVFSVIYMAPVAGFLALGLVTLIGPGAAVLAALGSLRREAGAASGAGSVAALAGTVPGQAASAPPTVMDLALLPRAGFWRRLLATAIDFCLLAILFGLVKQLAGIVWLAYHVILWATKGTTVGGMVVGLRIVREDGQPLTWGVALVRAVAAIFSALVLFLGFFWAGWSREKRAWHDRFAGTIVVKVPKGLALV